MEGEKTAGRSAGLDLLRIVSMLLVVTLHLLGRGGVLANAVPFTANYALAWCFESAAYCAVDCYALLTGYLLLRSRCRPGPLIALWMQVFFWSAGITALFALFREPVSAWRFLQSCLPVTFTQYWYFTAYFAVYCFAPFFNRLLLSLTRPAFLRLLGTLLALLSLLPTVLGADPFVTGKGYSFLWLAAVYCFGAYLRAYPPASRSARLWAALWAGCAAAQMLFRLVVERLEFLRTGAVGHGGWFLTYPSPLVLLSAVFLFLACRDARIRGRVSRALIGFFAPASFGVYLIHAQPFVFHRILDGALLPLVALPAWQFALAVPALTAAVFFSCALAQRALLALFRLLRLDAPAEALGRRLEALLPPV